MDYSPQCSSVQRILQVRILKWVAIFSSKASSQPSDQTCASSISCIGRWILYYCATGKWQKSQSPNENMLVVKNPPVSAGDIKDMGLIPGSAGSPGEEHGNPFQYYCLENPIDGGVWWATVHRVTKSWTWLRWLSMQPFSAFPSACVCAKLLQSCPTLCDPMDWRPPGSSRLPGSSVHGILQVRLIFPTQWSQPRSLLSFLHWQTGSLPLVPPGSSVQSLSHVRLLVTSCTAACQASLSITNSQSLLKLMFIKSVIPSNHLIVCPILLLPSIFPSIRVFPNESVLPIRWPKYCSFSFSISSSNEYSGLISLRMDWLDLLVVQGTLKSFL